MKYGILMGMILLSYFAVGQEMSVDLKKRNQAAEIANKAIVNIQQQNYEAAFPQLTRAISIDTTLRKPYLFLYTLATNREEYRDSALCLLQRAKKIFQQDDEICYYIGEIYKMKGDLNRAMMEYSMAIAYSKMNGADFYLVPHYYFNRATISLQKNRFSSAIIDYSYAIQLKPEYTAAYVNRGISLFQAGKPEDACTDWKTAMELGSGAATEYWERNCKEKE
ncbi:tetratricopeptide repeat protein [Marinifilum caeruleilacunae]|uniref:Tetratricopeptide repeat protein n=1 Tax=Marinifilum caeruleilacunae TaxID=2499076 RepID=A0ABX1WU26_9BACT|nr:hypothetical protein [Marinifilum caeruleilacunae]NOU59461.1 hypothetical protein [Marinifilum caeruleilacunae]